MIGNLEDALVRLLETHERVALILCDVPSTSLVQRFPTRAYQFLHAEQTAVLGAVGLAAEGYHPVVVIDARSFTGRASALLDAHAHACGSLCCIMLGTIPAGVVLPRLCRTTAAAGGAAAGGVLESWLQHGGVWACASG